MSRIPFLASLVVVALATDQANAQTPVAYQGRLEDAATGPVDEAYDIQFSIYDDPVAGSLVWTEDHLGVPVVGGTFTVKLGEADSVSTRNPIDDSIWADPSFLASGLYLSIAVRVAGPGSWIPMNNRQEILYMPRAVQANSIKACISRESTGNAIAGAWGPLLSACQAGEKLMAGGFLQVGTANAALNVTGSYPNLPSQAWQVSGYNSGSAVSVTVYAICCP